jgi:hypothetical protein
LLRWVPQWHQSPALVIYAYGAAPLLSLACRTVCRTMRLRGGVVVERRGFDSQWLRRSDELVRIPGVVRARALTAQSRGVGRPDACFGARV